MIYTLATSCAFLFTFFLCEETIYDRVITQTAQIMQLSHMTDNGNKARSEGVIMGRKR